MAREQILSDKRRQRILDRMPEVTTSSMVEEEDAELEESFDEKRLSRAPKRTEFEPANVASISDTGDLRAVDYLNLPETSGPSELKATTEEERAALEKKYGSWRAAKEAIKAEGDRYRAALQPKKGFEEDYDADVKFQEEEYGGGLERQRLVADIAGYDYVDESGRKQRARGEDEDLYADYYSKAKEKTPEASEEALQDAALKGVMKHRAREAELAIDEILRESDVEATEDVGAGLKREKTLAQREAEEAERLKKEKEKEKEKGKEKEREVVERALDKGKFKAERIRTLPDGTPIEEATEEYIKSSYGPDRVASAAKLALMKQTADARERRLPEQPTDEVDEVIEDTVDEAPSGESPLEAVLQLQRTQPSTIMSLKGVRGLEDIVPSVSALDDGRLSDFNRTFGKRPLGWAEYQGRDPDNRKQAAAALPTQLKESIREQLSSVVNENTQKLRKQLREHIGGHLLTRAQEEFGAVGGGVPEGHKETLIKQAEGLTDILIKYGAEDTQSSGALLGNVRLLPGVNRQEGDEIRKLLQGLGIGNFGSIMAELNSKLPDEQKKGILDLRDAEVTLNLLGEADTTPQIPVAEGGPSSPPPVRTEGSIDDSPVEDIIASAAEEQEG